MNSSNRSATKHKAKNRDGSFEQITAYQGPLPSPEILNGFEMILPGAAERIMLMAEKEQNHRHDVEKRITKGSIRAMNMGIFFALLAVIVIASLIAYSLYLGNTTAATALAAILVGIVSGFIWFRKKKD